MLSWVMTVMTLNPSENHKLQEGTYVGDRRCTEDWHMNLGVRKLCIVWSKYCCDFFAVIFCLPVSYDGFHCFGVFFASKLCPVSLLSDL